MATGITAQQEALGETLRSFYIDSVNIAMICLSYNDHCVVQTGNECRRFYGRGCRRRPLGTHARSPVNT
jgi:hypothetical protein